MDGGIENGSTEKSYNHSYSRKYRKRDEFHFRGSSTKESDPKTVEGWINQFTDNDDNKKTLVELYNAGFKNEVQDLKKRLKPLCELASIEEYYKSLNEQKEK